MINMTMNSKTNKMTRLTILVLIITLIACAPLLSSCSQDKANEDSTTNGKRVITDDGDRELEIPTADKIESVYVTSSLAQVYITCLSPELLAGTASEFTKSQLKFLPEGSEDLPFLGTLNSNKEIDRESLLTEDIDMIFSISGVGLTQQNISDAESLQKQTGIPVILIDGSFEKTPNAFRTLGDILDKNDRAEELANYCEKSYKEVSDIVKTIPKEDRISLYYAEGPEGLQTEPETSQHMQGFLEGGAKCVADCEETFGGGMTDVSLEQVLKWNPEVIVTWDMENRGGAWEEILKNPNWQEIEAVKTGRVYAMPNEPWAWCDRPPGVNRILGIHWIANLLYPDIYDVDMKEIVKEFFKVMYEVDVDDETIIELLGTSYSAQK